MSFGAVIVAVNARMLKPGQPQHIDRVRTAGGGLAVLSLGVG